MTDVENASNKDVGSPALEDRSLRELASARVRKLIKLVLPPSHEPVLDHMVSIWEKGLTAGLQMAEPPRKPESIEMLAEDVYAALEDADLLSQYGEFPELDDHDFQNLAYAEAGKLGRMIQPKGHPEVSGYTVEVWTDGLATGLRLAQREAER